MTSAHFSLLSESLWDAAAYVAGYDRNAALRLEEAANLLVALGRREAADERKAAGQPPLPGLVCA